MLAAGVETNVGQGFCALLRQVRQGFCRPLAKNELLVPACLLTHTLRPDAHHALPAAQP